jgi:hypothetical protein
MVVGAHLGPVIRESLTPAHLPASAPSMLSVPRAYSQPIALGGLDLTKNCTCLSDEIIDTIGRSDMFTQQQE